MKISSIYVNSFRSLCEFDLSLPSLSVLIGRNDAGKSNVLRAVQLLLDDRAISHVSLYDWSRASKRERYPRQIKIRAMLKGDSSLTICRKIEVDAVEEPPPGRRGGGAKKVVLKKASATSTLHVVDGSTCRLITSEEERRIPSFYYLRPRTGALQEAFDPRKENNTLTLIKDWMPPELRTERALVNLMRKYAPGETPLKAYAEFFEKEVLAALTTAFTPDFHVSLNVDYRSEGRGLLFVREMSDAQAKKAFSRLPLDHHGSGFIATVAMIFSIAVLQEYHRQLNKPLIIAVEEPEVHLHSNAQRTFLSYLKKVSKEHQVILTTHSPIFVDRAEPENVTVLRRVTTSEEIATKGSNKELKAGTTQPIADSYKDNWKEIVDTLGIHLSDALMAGEVNLVVEGATETVLLPAMAQALADNNQPSLNFDRVLVVSGSGGATPYMAKFLGSTGNPTLVIVDNDKGGEAILKGLKSLSCRVETFPMSGCVKLSAPLDKLEKFEFEDLLDSHILLDAFNEAFEGIPGFEFLPLKYEDFTRERQSHPERETSYGWIKTVGSLIGQRTTSANLQKKDVSKRVEKFILAKTAAKYVRAGKLPVPPFCQQLFIRINELLRS
jgi:predicted ATP-dependent endonuclease of OLD family